MKTNTVKPDPEFTAHWQDEISTEAYARLVYGDPARLVMEYLTEMAAQSERTQGTEQTKTLLSLVEQLLSKCYYAILT